MNNLICSTSEYSIGCTFLDWTINYLSGKDRHYNHRSGWHQLVDNPLTKINAHGHNKNHPRGLEELIKCVDSLQEHSQDFATIYTQQLSMIEAANKLGITTVNLSLENHKLIKKCISDDINNQLLWLQNKGAKLIILSLNKKIKTYKNLLRTTLDDSGSLFHIKQKPKTLEELQHSRDIVFFHDSYHVWQEQQLTDTWDVRERLALNAALLESSNETMDLSIPHYWIDSQEFWFDGDSKILDVMKWLDVPINVNRLEKWKPIFQQWSKIQIKNLRFEFTYQHIVDSIVNNWDYPIDLTFDQEVIIQHCLIYQHNLNLKTWQLEKFPNNTKELHTLLEPNIHNLN